MGTKLSCQHPHLEKFKVRGPLFDNPYVVKEYAYFQCPKCKLQCYRQREVFRNGMKGCWLGWETESKEDEQTIA